MRRRMLRAPLFESPYDWTVGPAQNRRTEPMFLSHTYRWLKPGGVLVFVIPGERLPECGQILASHFRDVRVYRLEAPESVHYKQVVIIGARRSRREKERLTDSDIPRTRLYYASLASIIMLSSVVTNPLELRSAEGTESAPSQQPGLDRAENLFPRCTKSFFCGAGRRSG